MHGDLFDVLPTLPEESIDACVTDPPYGIGFMGREWDTFKPEVVRSEFDLRQRKEFKDGAMSANIKGRKRSPAASPSQVQYDRSVHGQREFQAWSEKWAREVFRVLKPGAHILVCGAPRSFHRMTCGLEDAGFVIRDCFSWLYGQGFPKSLNFGDGQGTALKPGWEPIVLARKPFKGSLASNVERFGTGALNIDACRIGEAVESWPVSRSYAAGQFQPGSSGETQATGDPPDGRWPANVLLDEDAAAMLDKQTGELVSGANPERRGSDKFRSIYADFKGQETCEPARGLDIGGASRFYYVAKPSREERDYGCLDLAARSAGECTDRIDGSAGLASPRAGAGRLGGGKNFHPTVKPIELMRWLVKLVTPLGGTVLDPFTGSGTTGMACRYELREFIGLEREAEYVQIAERRIAAVAPLFSCGPPEAVDAVDPHVGSRSD